MMDNVRWINGRRKSMKKQARDVFYVLFPDFVFIRDRIRFPKEAFHDEIEVRTGLRFRQRFKYCAVLLYGCFYFFDINKFVGGMRTG